MSSHKIASDIKMSKFNTSLPQSKGDFENDTYLNIDRNSREPSVEPLEPGHEWQDHLADCHVLSAASFHVYLL